jgi:hypothetical protein
MKLFSFFIFLFSAGLSSAQYADSDIVYKKYSPQELKEDAHILEKALKENHPGYTWYSSLSSMDSCFALVFAQLDTPLTQKEFLRVLQPAITNIRCGHTDINSSEKMIRYLRRNPPAEFPLDIIVLNNKLYVFSAKGPDSTIQPGMEVLSVNGVTSAKIITRLYDNICSDGYNLTLKEDIAGEAFSSYYRFVFGLKDSVYIILRDSSNNITQKYLPVIVRKGKAKKKRKRQHLHFPKNFEFRECGRDTPAAVITYRAFEVKNQYIKFNRCFRKLRKHHVQNLVLDLRDNGGGRVMESLQFLRYLADTTFTFMVKKPDHAFTEKKYLRGKLKNALIRIPFILWHREKRDSIYYSIKVRPARRNHYHGKIIVLINGGSFSATCIVAAYLKDQHRAVFIGTETGGGEAGSNAMITPWLVLPNTGVQLRFPLYGIRHQVKSPNTGHGIMPDIPVTVTIEDMLSGRDPELKKAIDIILEGK